jgi:hypothetical protein
MQARPFARVLRRHLEGWQLGLLAVSLAALSVWLALPRPVEPSSVPLPLPDRRVLRQLRETDRELVAKLQREPLPFEVRAVGEMVRRHGAAVVASDAEKSLQARREARRLARAVQLAQGAAALVSLRALQTQLFLEAIERFRRGAAPDRDLLELGANFVEKSRGSGWLDAEGKLLLEQDELFVLFRVRWTELVGVLDDRALRPRLDEFRTYYRMLLERPEGHDALDREVRRMAYVRALSKIDSEYPEDLARGVLLYRLGRPDSASDAFLAHLATHGNGPYTLRAKNYALAALAQVEQAE